MRVAEFYYLEGGLFFGFLVAAGLTVISLSRPDYRVARRCAWAAAILFGSIAIVWGVTTTESAWIRIPAVGIAGLLAAISLTEALRFIKIREFPAMAEAPPVRRAPTLEATNRSVIDATGGQFPSDMPFPFAKADSDSFINMPGVKVTKNPDGTMTMSSGPVTQQFPPPTGEYTKLSKQKLKAEISKASSELRTFDSERSEAFRSLFAKYSNNDFSKNPRPSGFDNEWKALAEQFRPRTEHLAKLAQSLASECMVRISSLDGSTLSNAAQSGAGGVLNAKFAGPHPAFEAAEFLDELSRRLDRPN
jgi:hypothetical protein